MAKLPLSFACWNYDRTRALMDGSVSPDGIDLTYLNMPVEETFFRMLRNREFDIAEMSLSSYTVSLQKPERPFVALPVFPSRFFRHSCIYINANAGTTTIVLYLSFIGSAVRAAPSASRSRWPSHARTCSRPPSTVRRPSRGCVSARWSSRPPGVGHGRSPGRP